MSCSSVLSCSVLDKDHHLVYYPQLSLSILSIFQLLDQFPNPANLRIIQKIQMGK